MSEPNFRMLLRTSDIINRVPDNASLLREGSPGAGTKQGTELGAVHLVSPNTDGDPGIADSSAGLFLKVGTTLDGSSRNKVIRVGAAYVTSDGTRPDVRELNNVDVDYTGNFWYRVDTHDLSINTDGTHTAEAWKSLTPRYDRDVPTSYSLGGIEEGDTFNDLTIQQVFDKIFYPLTEVGITSFNIEPSVTGDTLNKVIEVGESIAIPGGINVRTLSISTTESSNITSVSYRGGNDLDSMQPAESIFNSGSYTGIGKNRIFTYVQSTPLSYAYPNRFYWDVLVTDGEGNTRLGPNRYVEWNYRCFAFSDPSDTIEDPVLSYTAKMLSFAAQQSKEAIIGLDLGVDGPQAPLHKITKAGKVLTSNPEYLYIYLPIGRDDQGNLVEDGYSPYLGVANEFGFPVAMEEPTAVVINRNLVTVRYLVYRTSIATRASYTINLS